MSFGIDGLNSTSIMRGRYAIRDSQRWYSLPSMSSEKRSNSFGNFVCAKILSSDCRPSNETNALTHFATGVSANSFCSFSKYVWSASISTPLHPSFLTSCQTLLPCVPFNAPSSAHESDSAPMISNMRLITPSSPCSEVILLPYTRRSVLFGDGFIKCGFYKMYHASRPFVPRMALYGLRRAVYQSVDAISIRDRLPRFVS